MNAILKHKTFLYVIIGIAIAALIVFAILFVLTTGATYVRIVDTSDLSKSGSTPDPGADISAVEIIKAKDGSVYYGTSIVSSNILDGNEGNTNKSKDASSALDSPQADQESRFVSLGGGEIVIKLNTKLKSGDQLTVYEIGTEFSKKGDSYDIYISNNSNGPWEHMDSGVGPKTITIE